MITDVMPPSLDSVFFGNSGAEVIDGAVKLARKATGRPAVIGFTGGFHGRTYAALSLTTSNVNYRTGHGPLVPDIHIAPFPNVYRDFGGDEATGDRGLPGPPGADDGHGDPAVQRGGVPAGAGAG